MVFTTVIYLRFLSVTIPIFAIGNYYKIKELFQDEKREICTCILYRLPDECGKPTSTNLQGQHKGSKKLCD